LRNVRISRFDLSDISTGSLFYPKNTVCHIPRLFLSASVVGRLSGLRYYDKRDDRKWQTIFVR